MPALCSTKTPFRDSMETGEMSNQTQHFCLRWNNHSANFVTVFEQLLKDECFTDCQVALNGGTLKCHKMVLAACSNYFQEVFQNTPSIPNENTTVIVKEVKLSDMMLLLDYIYKGEVNVTEEHLPELLKTAAFLRIKGLVESSELANYKTKDEPDSTLAMNQTAINELLQHSNTTISPRSSPTNNSNATIMPLYGKSPIERNPHHLPLWSAFPGLPMPQHPISGHQPPPRNGLSKSYQNETSPLGRKKYSSHMANRDTPILRNVLGKKQAENSRSSPEHHQHHQHHHQHYERSEQSYLINNNGSNHELDRRNSADLSESMEEDDKHITLQNYNTVTKSGGSKPEWKRYKQYTRENIMQAMNAVRDKEMSALQAARKYGVPSRTLYDKLKKAGILPSRGAGVQRRESSSSSARFPYSSESLNGKIYGNNSETNDIVGLTGSLSDYTMREAAAHLLLRARCENGNEDAVMNMPASNRCTPSPSIHSVHSNHTNSYDDEVEDLSVARSASSDKTSSVIVPAPVSHIKEEDEDIESDTGSNRA